MDPSRRVVTVLALVIAAACGDSDVVVSHGELPDAVGTSAPTVGELADATYRGILEQPVTLASGRWEGEPFVANGASRPTVGLIDHFVLRGDLDGDGVDEAVAVLWESSGGSGSRLYLAVMGRHLGTIDNLGTALIGDRVQILSGAIERDRIVLDVIRAGADDPACCPTEKARVSWVLGEHGLIRAGDDVVGTLSLTDLEGPEWQLLEIGGQPVADGVEITLVVNNERVAGESACNAYFAGVTPTGPGELAFTGMGATRRACPEPQMELERRYLKALAGASRYSFLAGRLAIDCRTDDGPTVLVFAPRQAPSTGGSDGG